MSFARAGSWLDLFVLPMYPTIECFPLTDEETWIQGHLATSVCTHLYMQYCPSWKLFLSLNLSSLDSVPVPNGLRPRAGRQCSGQST